MYLQPVCRQQKQSVNMTVICPGRVQTKLGYILTWYVWKVPGNLHANRLLSFLVIKEETDVYTQIPNFQCTYTGWLKSK